MQDNKYKAGDLVKIRLATKNASEKVWAEVMEVFDNKTLALRIDNKPLVTNFKLGDEVVVPNNYILDKYEEQ